IELGWLHEYGANGLKQVRSPNGGGTRTFDMHHNYQLQQAGLADANCMNITLHRTILQNELIGIFKNQDILHLILNISFVNELGQDSDGVSRDAYAGFWDSFYQKNTDGETYRVPILVNEYSQEEWGAIGRILLKGFIDHKYFPINLAPAFSIALILGEEHLTPSIDSILNIYDSLKTTVQKVIKLFNATPLCKEESTSFEFLKRFTRGRDSRQLKRLLRLLTGSDVICVDQILVSFVVRHGCQRIPTIHTCGPSLELPSTYLSFPDFRSEWENILENKESIKMTIA
ncbi:uncharacterized protein LOC130013114, partial [Patella vulgata]|uniref:uncharacterized protein LOC130013114 n=1 Tax=Patella vulgata TaxID=6465 RepID=UPI0024A99B0C